MIGISYVLFLPWFFPKCFRKKNCTNLLNKFSYCFTFSNKPCTCNTKQQNTTDINRACKYSECPICKLQIQLQEQQYNRYNRYNIDPNDSGRPSPQLWSSASRYEAFNSHCSPFFYAGFILSVIVIWCLFRCRNHIFSIKVSDNSIGKCFRIFDDRHMHQWPLLRICRTQICFFNGIIPQYSFLGFHLFLKICCLTACNITAGAVK